MKIVKKCKYCNKELERHNKTLRCKSCFLKENHKISSARKKHIAKLNGINHWNYKDGRSIGENRQEYLVKYGKKWIEENRDYKNYLNLRRYALKKNAKGFHTYKQWESLKIIYNKTCPCCKKQEPEIILTQDHIMPLSKGGSDNIENIQPLCKKCNSIKNARYKKYKNIRHNSTLHTN